MRSVLATSVTLALVAPAQTAWGADDIEAIRQEIRAMRESYEARIQALEQRLKQAEQKADKAQAAAAPATTAAAPAPQAGASPAGKAAYQGKGLVTNNAFNPAISVILDAKYQNLSKDPATYQIGGFIPAGDEMGPGARSFNLGESELNFTANIDPYFYGAITAALTPENEVELEEAFIQTLALPGGLTAKAGRFFSAIGYLNEQHAHVWDFVDAPLAYQALFGPQFKQEGVQLKWLAPTPIFFEIGAEAGNGREFPGSERNKNGLHGAALFANLGGDVGASNSWRAGASFLRHKPRDRAYEDSDSLGNAVENVFSGDSKTLGLNFVWKWAPNGDATQRNFKFQAEYFNRKEDGILASNSSAGLCAGGCEGSYESKQKGFYAQAVYQFIPRWRAGLRYDWLDSGTPSFGLVADGTLAREDFSLLSAHKPKRVSAMLDFSPSEFSRLRLQLSQDKARFNETDNQVFLQYIMSLGAHGAHKY